MAAACFSSAVLVSPLLLAYTYRLPLSVIFALTPIWLPVAVHFTSLMVGAVVSTPICTPVVAAKPLSITIPARSLAVTKILYVAP